MRLLLSVLAALLLVTAAAAAPLPAEPPPLTVALDFRTVRVNGDNLEVDRVVTVFEIVPKPEVREIDGRKVTVIVQAAVPVTRIVREAQPIKGVKAVTADGKPVDAAALAQRLARSTVVVVVTGEATVPPAVRGMLRDDVLVLGLPPRPERPVDDGRLPRRD
jgi:hypothetical protein